MNEPMHTYSVFAVDKDGKPCAEMSDRLGWYSANYQCEVYKRLFDCGFIIQIDGTINL